MPISPNRNRARSQARQTQALALRIQGGSYAQIAEQLRASETVPTPPSYDKARAFRDVEAALARQAAEMDAVDFRVWVQLEVERLDALHAKYWVKAMSRDGDYMALDRVLAIMDRRTKLLGLTAPDRDALAAELAAQAEGNDTIIIRMDWPEMPKDDGETAALLEDLGRLGPQTPDEWAFAINSVLGDEMGHQMLARIRQTMMTDPEDSGAYMIEGEAPE